MKRLRVVRNPVTYHGTHERRFSAHEGVCLTPSASSASTYGPRTWEVHADFSGLNIREVDVQDDAGPGDFPGDSARERRRYRAEGVDVLSYLDQDMHGRDMRCYRLLTGKALERIRPMKTLHKGKPRRRNPSGDTVQAWDLRAGSTYVFSRRERGGVHRPGFVFTVVGRWKALPRLPLWSEPTRSCISLVGPQGKATLTAYGPPRKTVLELHLARNGRTYKINEILLYREART